MLDSHLSISGGEAAKTHPPPASSLDGPSPFTVTWVNYRASCPILFRFYPWWQCSFLEWDESDVIWGLFFQGNASVCQEVMEVDWIPTVGPVINLHSAKHICFNEEFLMLQQIIEAPILKKMSSVYYHFTRIF